jgi:lysophospholipase L1-like esterase
VAAARRHTDRVLLVGLHPNGAGHQLLADRIGERLARWL